MEKINGIPLSFLYLKESLTEEILLLLLKNIEEIHNLQYIVKEKINIYENYSNKIFQAWDFETQQFYIKLYKQLKKAQEK